MLQDFSKFIRKGNVVDLAVAVVIGTAFSAVIASLVADIINPIIAAIFGEPDLSALTISIGDAEIKYGSFMNTIIYFLIVAAAIFFLVVKPMMMVDERAAKANAGLVTIKTCPECLSDIPVGARRCMHCGQPQTV